MTIFRRLLIVGVCASLYWGAGILIPAFVAPITVKSLCGLFGFLLTLEIFVWNQLNTTSGAGVLHGNELLKLNFLRAELRQKIYWTSGIVILAMFAMYILSFAIDDLPRFLPPSLLIGFLVGAGANYLAVILSWINQLANFADRLRQIEQSQKDFSDQMKRLSDAKKVA